VIVDDFMTIQADKKKNTEGRAPSTSTAAKAVMPIQSLTCYYDRYQPGLDTLIHFYLRNWDHQP
jgi:hypothetical protein